MASIFQQDLFSVVTSAQQAHWVCGVDEAGRGPLAGAVFAAAVVLDQPIIGLKEKKPQTNHQKRGKNDNCCFPTAQSHLLLFFSILNFGWESEKKIGFEISN